MPITVNDHQVQYVCKNMLGVLGTPNFCNNKEEIYKILSQCDSYLELMAFLGMCYYIQGENFEKINLTGYHTITSDEIGGSGIVITGSELHMKSKQGYYYLVVVPQYKKVVRSRYTGEAITLTHDFVFFIPKVLTSFGSRHQILCAIEVDGYAVHNGRRQKDVSRDRSVSYPVIRLLEEKENLLTWFKYLDPGSPDFLLGGKEVQWAF